MKSQNLDPVRNIRHQFIVKYDNMALKNKISNGMEKIEVEIEKRAAKRIIKKRGKMKVSGAGVKKLAKIIGRNKQ